MKSPVILGVLMLIPAWPVRGDVIKVPQEFPTIQAGIDAARDGDVVLIADGEYTGPGNRDISFRGKAITVRGKGGPDRCTINCERLGRGFVFDQDETNASVLAGVTITNGLAPPEYDGGGGIFARRSAPVIRDCVIRDCEAGTAGGGGVFVDRNAILRNCRIINNRAYACGGILSLGAQVIDCTISGNVSEDVGAGIFADGGVIRGCTITDNHSTGNHQGGGINAYSALVEDCVITGNSARSGGGIAAYSDTVVRNCLIADNRADEGGGLTDSWFWGSMTVEHCTITGNTANWGGAAALSGKASLTNCQITANVATGVGGAILIGSDQMTRIVNCTLAANEATTGGAVFVVQDGRASILNSILWNNAPNEVSFVNPPPEIRYSDVKGGFEGEGNIDADPLFVEGPRGGFYLSQIRAGQPRNSPCVDAGLGEAQDGDLTNTTTRTDERKDRREVDIGYHYPRR
ncbi:MAG: hypothetical protein C4547_08395 [Phycisphaerales bacterium]|nr:MAG: hypothetical protein C4547_08395 [Phycisphaerales bacterium]